MCFVLNLTNLLFWNLIGFDSTNSVFIQHINTETIAGLVLLNAILLLSNYRDIFASKLVYG